MHRYRQPLNTNWRVQYPKIDELHQSAISPFASGFSTRPVVGRVRNRAQPLPDRLSGKRGSVALELTLQPRIGRWGPKERHARLACGKCFFCKRVLFRLRVNHIGAKAANCNRTLGIYQFISIDHRNAVASSVGVRTRSYAARVNARSTFGRSAQVGQRIPATSLVQQEASSIHLQMHWPTAWRVARRSIAKRHPLAFRAEHTLRYEISYLLGGVVSTMSAERDRARTIGKRFDHVDYGHSLGSTRNSGKAWYRRLPGDL